MKHDLIRTTLIDPVTAVRVRSAINQALRAGSSLRDARSEGRGYLRAICPSLPREQVSEAVDSLLLELAALPERFLPDIFLRGGPAQPAPGQLSLGL
ncbi:hypothetical protein [Roseomonas sp. 18066]|uniref:hypothetical protein n=1 Tax=Roseomonas sp. 18066 TaxID=2681412 RepID=UPI00135A4ED8|nr:hypothetical protein [Roseomonas sp. 18066]